jgi:hypothetical protein
MAVAQELEREVEQIVESGDLLLPAQI